MGGRNVCVVLGVNREEGVEVLHVGAPSALRDVLPAARRMHDDFREILVLDRVSRREMTRSDLPEIVDVDNGVDSGDGVG